MTSEGRESSYSSESFGSVHDSTMTHKITKKQCVTMDLLLIAAGFSLIGIGLLVAFARHVDPLSGRFTGRLRKR